MSQGRPDISVVIGSMRTGGAERATMHLINGLSKKIIKETKWLTMNYQI